MQRNVYDSREMQMTVTKGPKKQISRVPSLNAAQVHQDFPSVVGTFSPIRPRSCFLPPIVHFNKSLQVVVMRSQKKKGF